MRHWKWCGKTEGYGNMPHFEKWILALKRVCQFSPPMPKGSYLYFNVLLLASRSYFQQNLIQLVIWLSWVVIQLDIKHWQHDGGIYTMYSFWVDLKEVVMLCRCKPLVYFPLYDHLHTHTVCCVLHTHYHVYCHMLLRLYVTTVLHTSTALPSCWPIWLWTFFKHMVDMTLHMLRGAILISAFNSLN